MRNTRPRDTTPELKLRRALHARGLRYRVNSRPEPDLRTKADVVFSRARVAIYVDGCFWHACPEHGNLPKANREWWRQKLATNVQRDRVTEKALSERGWRVVRVWEHELPESAASRIDALVRTPAGR